MDRRLAVIAVITNDAGQVLSVTRRDRPGDYTLPGGKVEEGERPSYAATRECYEETGVSVTYLEYAFSAVGANPIYDIDVFRVVAYRGTPRQKEDGIEVAWIDPLLLLSRECTCRLFYEKHFSAIFGK